MSWFGDLIDITDNVLSTVIKPVKEITGAVKETVEEIVDDIKG